MSHLVFFETSGSGVNAIDYAKQAGHTVTYLYSPAYDFTAPPDRRELARRLADHTVEVNGADGPESHLAAMRSAGVRTDNVECVLSTLAFGAAMGAELAAKMGVRGTPAEAVAMARDKGRCRQVLDDEKLPNLGYSVVHTMEEALRAADDIGYPVIVKPVLGVAKAATAIAHGPDQVRGYFAQLAKDLRALPTGMASHFDERFAVEELAIGDLYSVEVAADGTSFVPLASAARKTGLDNPILEMGCTVPSGLDEDDERELGAYSAQVCQALGLNLGIFHLEIMHTADGFRLIEANPRIAGGNLPDTIKAAVGQNLFAILIDLYLGRPAPPGPLTASAASSHSLLASTAAATVREDLAPDWFDKFLDRVHSGWVRATPGGRLAAMRGNFDTFGMIRAVDADHIRAEAACTAVKDDIARELGIRLVPEDTRKLFRSASS